MAVSDRQTNETSPTPPPSNHQRRKALTIGAVAKILSREFDDVSISKIRYLEDQKLVTPRRTQGGYRLYSQADVDRVSTILRLQRDEFLPLRVIRQELAAGPSLSGLGNGTSKANTARRAKLIGPSSSRFSLEDVARVASCRPPSAALPPLPFSLPMSPSAGGRHPKPSPATFPSGAVFPVRHPKSS